MDRLLWFEFHSFAKIYNNALIFVLFFKIGISEKKEHLDIKQLPNCLLLIPVYLEQSIVAVSSASFQHKSADTKL